MEIGYITLTNIRLCVCNADKSHEIERKRMDQVSNYLISLEGVKYQFSYAVRSMMFRANTGRGRGSYH